MNEVQKPKYEGVGILDIHVYDHHLMGHPIEKEPTITKFDPALSRNENLMIMQMA